METEIFVEDCIQGMTRLPTGCVDVVVTSPPYNCGIAYRSYRDELERGEYLAWTEEWSRCVKRILSEDGSLFLNLGGGGDDPLLVYEVVFRLSNLGFHLQNTIHWIKAISLDQSDGSVISRGHFKPINSRRRLNNCHEYVFHLTKSGAVPLDRKAVGVPYADKSNIARWGHTDGEDRRCRGNTWFVPYHTIRSRDKQRPHPATFPVELAERCLRLHGRARPVVMDPFLGIGSAAEAAARVGASRFIGFEVDAEYAAFARARVQAIIGSAAGSPASIEKSEE
jgi:site-specific DNA-methyltransferase (adenine-specific)